MTVLLFGVLRELAGANEIHLDIDADATVTELRAALARQAPDLADALGSCRVAVDGRYAEEATPVGADAEIALIPPVSGGAPVPTCHVELRSSPIDVEALRRWVTTDATGGTTVFTGTVRDHHEGKRVLRLEYEAYARMAEPALREIAEGVADAYGLARVAVVHRLGPLAIGDAAICVAASAAHRGETFEAVAEMMNRIKHDVPIFKHEFYADGSDAWVRCAHLHPSPEGAAP